MNNRNEVRAPVVCRVVYIYVFARSPFFLEKLPSWSSVFRARRPASGSVYNRQCRTPAPPDASSAGGCCGVDWSEPALVLSIVRTTVAVRSGGRRVEERDERACVQSRCNNAARATKYTHKRGTHGKPIWREDSGRSACELTLNTTRSERPPAKGPSSPQANPRSRVYDTGLRHSPHPESRDMSEGTGCRVAGVSLSTVTKQAVS